MENNIIKMFCLRKILSICQYFTSGVIKGGGGGCCVVHVWRVYELRAGERVCSVHVDKGEWIPARQVTSYRAKVAFLTNSGNKMSRLSSIMICNNYMHL